MTEQALTTKQTGGDLSTQVLERIGQAVNEAAAQNTFERYRERKAENTILRQDGDLVVFRRFLEGSLAGLIDDDQTRAILDESGDLAHDPGSWSWVTWGIVVAFVDWLLQEGYSVGTVNARLSTIKTYAKLAAQSGALDRAEYQMIRTVEGYSHSEGRKVDEKREQRNGATRRGYKKADPVVLTKEQAETLKTKHASDGQGRRDALLMCVFLDLGCRAGEVHGMTVEGINLGDGEITFYREKVGKTQTHDLINGSLKAARAYLEGYGAPTAGALFLTTDRRGALQESPMSKRAIGKRVNYLGRKLLEIENLSPHDLRHTWATLAARAGTALDRLMDAGGWNSPAMPMRYVESAAIANQGINLG